MDKSICINLYSGPGAGKSTTAAKLFSEMKCRGMDVELVTEYAKDLVWSDRHYEFGDQFYILAKQYHRLWKLNKKVKYIVTDSPLILNYAYQVPTVHIREIIKGMYEEFDNLNYFINRTKKYNPKGRMQSEGEAKLIDTKIFDVLKQLNIDFKGITSHQTEEILKDLDVIEHSINSVEIG
jgi:hypothetical protein